MTFVFSWSAIECFEVCPAQFYHKYVLRIKEPPTPALEKGRKIHDVCEQMMHADTPSTNPLIESVRKAKYGKKLHTELRMGLTRDFKPCGFFEKGVWGRNAVDVLLTDYPVAINVDWKTGKVRDKVDQLMLCALFIFTHFPRIDKVRSFNLFIEHNKIGEVFTFERGKIPDYWASFLPRIEKIEHAVACNDFKKTPGPLCGWCPVTECLNNRR